jgi:lipopolysaccharide heptosyltransferase II
MTLNLNLARHVDKWVGWAICLVLFAGDRLLRGMTGRRVPSMLATTPPPEDGAVHVPQRILCMKFYGLGNAIMLLPVLAAIRERYPNAEIDFLTMPGNTGLLTHSGQVTNAIGVETDTVGQFVRSMTNVLRAVRRRRYDTVVDFEQFVKISTIIGFWSGARERIGFNTDGQRRGFMYTRRVVYTDSDHMTAIFARLLQPLGISGPLRPVPFPILPTDRRNAAAFLGTHGIEQDHFPLVAMHLGMGANFYQIPLKRWPLEHFATLADRLATEFGARVIFTGQGDDERQLIAQARARMQHPAIDGSNQFSITQLAALLERCHFVVANDTSVMHLAAAAGTPVVSLFGPTAPLHYGPRGDRNLVFYRDLYCSPCLTNYNLKQSRCVDPVCIRLIDPHAVFDAIVASYLGNEAVHRNFLRGRVAAATAAT